jgi:NADH-quinone oxidoreductase subunit L
VLDLVWLIPAFPLAGFLILFFFGRRLGDPLAGWLGSAALLGSFLTSVVVFVGLVDRPEDQREFVQNLYSWVPVDGFQVDLGFLVDPLSVTMVLFVTFVAFLIHVYSIGYMKGDERFPTFFAYLNLFVFFMLMLSLGSSLLVTFLGWEGVGACSYLLISFWFTDEANAAAGKKAFITNRVGDFGFMLAMFLTFSALGSLTYTEILPAAPLLAAGTVTAIVLLLFVGVAGKSAQIPLYVWLPDAMAGPTPVSALIHAATMVTAGVYLLIRINPFMAVADDWAIDLITWIGALTALFAATIAVAQRDIKKVLAYSTISQLGYMVFVVALGANVAGLFHVITHAFFKALLFLAAGSVIHGMHHEQDMQKMGGLRKFMPFTAALWIVGWLAISGVPPLSGFWSKDEILAVSWQEEPLIWLVGIVTAILTAFYMSRATFLTFFGEERFRTGGEGAVHLPEPDPDEPDRSHEQVDHGELAEDDHGHGAPPHESPRIMVLPMAVLAVFALGIGVLNLPFTDSTHWLEAWLEPSLSPSEVHLELTGALQWALAAGALLLVLVGILVARWVYLKHPGKAKSFEPTLFANAWYLDRGLSTFVAGPGRALFDAVAWFDRTVVDGAVNGAAVVVKGAAVGLRRTQSGFVRSYALAVAIGAVVVVGWLLSRAGW